MVTSITKILRFKLTHNYSEYDHHFDIWPNEQTRQILKRKKLIFKYYKGEYGLFGTTAFPVDQLFSQDEYDCLTFYAFSKSSQFLSYSNLPLNKPSNQIFFVHNQHTEESQKLTAGEKYILSKSNLITLKRPSFVYNTDDRRLTTLHIYDWSQDKLIAVCKKNRESLFDIDLKNAGSGFFKICDEEDNIIDQIYTSQDVFRQKPALILSFNVNRQVLDKPLVYEVCINSRELFWAYKVIPGLRQSLSPEKLFIRAHNNKTTFSLRKTENDFIFMSNQKLKLGQGNKVKLELILRESDGNLVLVDSLPHPGPENVKISQELDIYSELTVYV